MGFDARGLTGTMLAGRYFVGDLAGETDIATTFHGADTRMGCLIDISVVRAGLGADSTAAQAMELDTMTACEIGHPNIVTPRDVGVLEDGSPFVITAQVPGATLEDRVCTRAGLVPGDVVRIGLDMLSALAAAHELGVVHGDLRPESIFLVERDGLVLQTLLSGFGRRTWSDECFAAPELVAGGAPSVASDLYAAAALLHFAATGFPPPRKSASPSALRTSLRWLPARVARVLTRALDEEPMQRFASAREMLHALDVGRGTFTVDGSGEPASVPRIPMALDAVRPMYGLRADASEASRAKEPTVVQRLRSDVVPARAVRRQAKGT